MIGCRCKDSNDGLEPLKKTTKNNVLLGGYSSEVPPLPIPNREVKLAAACLRWSPSGSFCSCCSCLRRIALCCPRIPCRLRILLSLRPTDPVAAALFMVALLILPAPQLLQTPHPPQPPAPQIPPGGRCSWWRCRFFRRRSSCRLRILLSPRLRSFRRDVAVLGGVADSSGPEALADSVSSSVPGTADPSGRLLFMVALPILPAPHPL